VRIVFESDRPDEGLKPPASKVETACHKAYHAIQHVLDLLGWKPSQNADETASGITANR
jgi:hypothetical protein